MEKAGRSFKMVMVIHAGLFSHMVLQRDGKVAQKAAVTGTYAGKGNVYARVLADGKELRGWKRRKVGTADGKRFAATMAGLPVGGPYDVELICASDSVVVEDVLVGDVWILAGQSNMQGCGHFPEKPLGKDPLVRAFYMDDHWDVAVDPIHQLDIAVDPVHNPYGNLSPFPAFRGVGPGVSFGQSMRKRTGIPQGLIACAHSGSSTTEWNPKLKKLGGRSFYGATMRRLAKNFPGGSIAGLLWYQGCIDAEPEAYQGYRERTVRIFRAFRKDLRRPDLPIVMVQIANIAGNYDEAYDRRWSSVREDERLIGEAMPNVATVPSLDLELDEWVHLSGPSQYELGRRMAEAMESIRLAGRKSAPVRPITLESVEVSPYEDGRAVITATFGNVVGKLVSGSRPTGFTLEIGAFHTLRNITCVHLKGNQVVILTTVIPRNLRLEQWALWYGFGTDPYCNIHDEAGRSLPAFGPYFLGSRYPVTSSFAGFSHVGVSDFFPATKDLSDCAICPDESTVQWDVLEKPDGPWPQMVDLHELIGKRFGKDEVVYFRTVFHCDGDWKLNLLLGYDGPVRVWLDGREVFYDPNGTNPANRDDKAVPVKAKAGDHSVVIALGTNGGNAWGVFLRLERLAIPKKESAGGKEPALPYFLECKREKGQ